MKSKPKTVIVGGDEKKQTKICMVTWRQ